ncbi:MAG: DUF4174 domain-containing protein [Luteolibacter sp.]
MKLPLLILLPWLTCISMADEPKSLDDYRWKHRILVVPESSKTILAKLKHFEIELSERDVILVVMENSDAGGIGFEIASRFGIEQRNQEILLIGKDGKTTIRWIKTEFAIEKLFQRIDAMPMRQREIRMQTNQSPNP